MVFYPIVEPVFCRPELEEGLPLVVDLDGVPLPSAAGNESDGFLCLLNNANSFFLCILDEIWNLGCLVFWILRFHCWLASGLRWKFQMSL